MKFLTVITFAMTIYLSSTSAIASSISTFNLTNIAETDIIYGGSTRYVDSISIDQDNVNLNITAWSSADAQNSTSPNWTQVTNPYGIDIDSSGLGIKSSRRDSKELDGKNGLESLLFSFSPQIELLSVTFKHFYNDGFWYDIFNINDDFNLTVDGELTLKDEAVNSSYYSAITFAINESGNQFRIWADHKSDNFRIASLEIATTPLPAGIWLFGTAMFGLISFRRRAQLKA